MKILIVTDVYINPISEAAISMSDYVQQLNNSGHQARILTVTNTAGNYTQHNIYYARTILWGRPFYDEILHWHPDVLHYQCQTVKFKYILKLAKNLNIPVIQSIADTSSPICRPANALLASDKPTAIALNRSNANIPVYTVRPGMSLKAFQSPVKSTKLAEIKRELGISLESTVLLAAGKITADQNLDVLIDIMTISEVQNACFKLLIVGDGPALSSLRHRVELEDLGQYVKFAGNVSHSMMPLYYRIGHIYVSAAEHMISSLCAIEAMACGLPLIIPANACDQLIMTDTYNGYTYTSRNDFITAIETIQANEHIEKNMRNHSLSIAENFSNERYLENMLQLYEEIIHTHGIEVLDPSQETSQVI